MIERYISLAASPENIGLSTGEAIDLGWKVTVLGVSIVFSALVTLILLTWLYPKIAKFLINKHVAVTADRARKKVEKLAAKQAAQLKSTKAVTDAEVSTKAIDDNVLVAVITAAIAASLGTSSNGIIIKSLRRSVANVPAWGIEGRNEQVYNRF